MEIEILYEDEDTIVINKPVGVVVNRADSVKETTIQDWIENKFPNNFLNIESKVFLQRSGICHRLDKETSGCLMIAKHPEALRYYLKQFKDRLLKKEYLALVHGKVEPNEGEVILPLKRSPFDREKWQVHYEGKRAVTSWTVLKRYSYLGTEHWKNTLTLLRVGLKTGRTHQIRVHLSFLGWPIFADAKYLNKDLAKKDREFLSHHFLHAANLELNTYSGVQIKIEAPLPKDETEILEKLMLE